MLLLLGVLHPLHLLCPVLKEHLPLSLTDAMQQADCNNDVGEVVLGELEACGEGVLGSLR